MKTSEKFRDTQSVPFMLDKTRKPPFPQLGTKKIFKKKLRIFFLGKCRILPKNVKGGPFGVYKHTFCWKISKKLEEGTLLRH